MTSFCPKCGATGKPLYQRLCADCFISGREFTTAPKTLTLIRCRRCSAVLHRGAWLEDSPENLSRIVESAAKTTLHNPAFKTELRADTAALTVTGSVDPAGRIKTGEQKNIKIEYKERLCETCARRSAGQYEAEIQLRRATPHDAERFKKLASIIKKAAHSLQREDERAKAFWWTESKHGTDFFFGYRQTAQQVISSLQLKRNAYSTSHQFLGYDRSGKKKVRTTYCMRA